MQFREPQKQQKDTKKVKRLTLTLAPKCWAEVPISIEFCMSSLLLLQGGIR